MEAIPTYRLTELSCYPTYQEISLIMQRSEQLNLMSHREKGRLVLHLAPHYTQKHDSETNRIILAPGKKKQFIIISLLHANGVFLYLLNTSENL